MMRRSGFTLIEVIMAVMIIGLLASIAVPKYRDIKLKANAMRIIGEFDAVRYATMSFYVDSTYYPAEAKAGEIPPNLAPYLPVGFTMTKPQWTLDYEHWFTTTTTESKTGKGKGKGVPVTKTTKTETIIGLAFTIEDTALGRTALRLMGNAPAYTTGKKYTFLISAF